MYVSRPRVSLNRTYGGPRHPGGTPRQAVTSVTQLRQCLQDDSDHVVAVLRGEPKFRLRSVRKKIADILSCLSSILCADYALRLTYRIETRC
jgi:hypothetical protein